MARQDGEHCDLCSPMRQHGAGVAASVRALTSLMADETKSRRNLFALCQKSYVEVVAAASKVAADATRPRLSLAQDGSAFGAPAVEESAAGSRATVARRSSSSRTSTAPTTSQQATQSQPSRSCPLCPYVPAVRSGPQLVIHFNTVHMGRGGEAGEEALASARLEICGDCGEAMSASNAGRNAHRTKGCGTFQSRNTRIQAANARFSATPGVGEGRDEEAPERPNHTTGCNRRTGSLPCEPVCDAEYFGTRPPTTRFLKRWGWSQYVSSVLTYSLRGYSADSTEGRVRRQFAFVSLIRQRFKKGSVDTDAAPSGGFDPATRVEALVEMGALGKAARTLASNSGPQTIDDEVLNTLRRLHPTAEEVAIPQSFEMHQIPGISEDEVARTVRRKLSRGAAPAMDGWTRELLVPLIEDQEALPEFTAMIGDLANGVTSAEVISRLMAAPLIPLGKPDGGTRPIAVESVIVKLISHIALDRITATTWEKAFPGSMQFGIGPSANVEAAIRRVRSLVSHAPNGVLVDCTNAYNTLSREAIVDRLAKNPGLSPLYRLAAWSLRHTPLIVIDKGKAALHLRSETGVRQGSVLGPLLFCLAIHPILQKIAATTDVDLVAYLDDITIISRSGSPRAASLAFTALERELAILGLRVNRTKTMELGETEVEGINKWEGRGAVIKLLGAALWLGENMPIEPITAMVSKSMRKHEPFFTRLREGDLRKSTQLNLLQACAAGRATFLIRVHPAETTFEAAAYFDKEQEKCLRAIVGDDAQLSDIASLPTKMGGLGLRCVAELAEIAYNSEGKGAQHIGTADLDDIKERGVRATMSYQDCQIFKSFAAAGMGPTRASNDAVQLYVRERLFLPIASDGAKCTCGQKLTSHHVHSCPSLGAARIRRHDLIKKLLVNYAARSYVVREEPSRILASSRARPDLQIALPEGALNVDVSCTYAGLRTTSTPLEARAREKIGKYAESFSPFTPFCVASTGELGKSAVELLARILPRPWERSVARGELKDALMEGNWGLLRAALV